jgi:hypothetical protein
MLLRRACTLQGCHLDDVHFKLSVRLAMSWVDWAPSHYLWQHSIKRGERVSKIIMMLANRLHGYIPLCEVMIEQTNLSCRIV